MLAQPDESLLLINHHRKPHIRSNKAHLLPTQVFSTKYGQIKSTTQATALPRLPARKNTHLGPSKASLCSSMLSRVQQRNSALGKHTTNASHLRPLGLGAQKTPPSFQTSSEVVNPFVDQLGSGNHLRKMISKLLEMLGKRHGHCQSQKSKT